MDTGKRLWGDNWKMPTRTDFDNLLSTDNTDGGNWVTSYNSTGVNGILVKGQTGTDYEDNEVFFPAAGDNDDFGDPERVGSRGSYWSSTPTNDASAAWFLQFYSGLYGAAIVVNSNTRDYGFSVRAVLAE